MRQPTEQEIRKLAAFALVDPRTVKRAYEGDVVRDMIRFRIIEAAKKLKLPAPPVCTKEKRK